ncbi:HNH endonuclease signature motif containing protein [Brevibacillus laterosporus]|uniref:HNH endonuclease signature motif containing protein n=1 Tax=Brevibacillus laterosporus TaxID=1465 RepID=UPI003D1E95DA
MNPLCVRCKERQKITAATVVDHITPHKGDVVLFWDEKNWQGLCTSCHSRKTAKEDGGFNNRAKVR